ncbi:histone-lysine N-methyltransferase eggless-like isoform X2 [Cimex lectularius]|uniref:Histone-lysine N-methyltransferase eggless n=1 Tax=Cimex lectularius TaxID=79782 RepID=A0A8I6SH08_CIMLE|nr:histone-lysine N-methyltransferase eggless-like isoform X2 [Cimex lectularius]
MRQHNLPKPRPARQTAQIRPGSLSDPERQPKPHLRRLRQERKGDDYGSLDPTLEAPLSCLIDSISQSLFQKIDLKKQVKAANEWLDNKTSQVLEKVKQCQREMKEIDSGLYTSMQELYETYRPVTKEMPSIDVADVPNVQVHSSVTPTVTRYAGNKRYSQRTVPQRNIIQDRKMAIKSTANTFRYIKLIDPSNKPIPKVGDKFFVEKRSIQGYKEWVPATVDKILKTVINGKYEDRYKVKVENMNDSELNREEIDSSRLAYYYPCNLKLDIGSRVIAPHSVNQNHRMNYQSGIVAELPTRLNKYRYLVFYDRGASVYVPSNEVRYVLDCKKQPHEYFDVDSQEFIRSYLTSFPERPMLRVKPLERVKTRFRGVWFNARVIEVDASLIKVLFLNNGHSEWIYRGSPRLYPVFEKKRQIQQDTPTGKIRHRGTTVNQSQGPYIQYEVVSSDDDSDTSSERSITIKRESNISSGTVRAVARKSVTKPNSHMDHHYTHHSIQRRTSERRSTRLDYGKIIRKYPQGILNPRNNRPHSCSPYCVSWVTSENKKIKAMNPLAIPSVYAFKRDTEDSNVTYLSPCGKKLRSCEDILTFLRLTKLPLTIDLFDFDPAISIFDEFVVAQDYILIEDVSRGSEIVPIPCINTHDDTIPDLMEYMTERRGLEGVNLNTDPGFLFGCDCTDNCQDKSKCACWQQTINQARSFNYHLDPDKIGYQNRRLPEMLLTGIYECNSTCKCCQKTCLNRVVQHPLKIKLQLFKTKKKGWGTRCVNDIPAGTFICVYVGNILNEQYANETGRTHGDEYFAELDYIEVLEEHKENYEEFPPDFDDDPEWLSSDGERSNERTMKRPRDRCEGNEDSNDNYDQSNFAMDNDEDRNRDSKPSVRSYYGPSESVYIMDAKVAGNIGRYLNHSCDPNIFVQNVFVDTHDLRFPWVSFFALKYIPAGTELTWNYGYNVDSVPGKKLYCYCEAANCRRRLL